MEQLKYQPSNDFSDTMEEDGVIFLCSDKSFDIKVHKPTPPVCEIMMKEYILTNLDEIELEVTEIKRD